jgi:hypothetical protein
VKKLEGDMLIGILTSLHTLEGKENNHTFFVTTSQALHVHTSQSERIVNSSCNHYMAKYASLFSSLKETIKKICVSYDYALAIVGCGKIFF